ncbi:MAG: tripartite tricarboxylate transporter TctB family protein [Rhodoglobus sp.]
MTSPQSGSSGVSTPGEPRSVSEEPSGRRIPIGEYLFAALAAGIGIYVLIAANYIRIPISSNTLGPRSFPYLVGALLLCAGIAVFIGVRRGRLGEAEEGEDVDSSVATDWVTVAKLVAFFTAHAYLIEFIGWPFAAALLFAGAAWSLGAQRLRWAIPIALALAFTIYFLFGRLLGLSLPAGPLLDWMPFF